MIAGVCRCAILGMCFGLVVGLVAPSRARAGDPQPFEQHVNQAIELGVNFLQKEALSSFGATAQSYPIGMRALIAYALIESGVPAGSAGIERLFGEIERLPLTNVYGVALLAIALDSRARALGIEPGSDAKVERQIARCVTWLVDARLRGKGIWGYQRMPSGTSAVKRSATWVDFSNSQFAALALQVALRWKIEIPERVLNEMLAAYEEAGSDQLGPSWLQFEGSGWWDDTASAPASLHGPRDPESDPLVSVDGHTYLLQGVAKGWPYRPRWNLSPSEGANSTHSMIAAATSSLMVVRSGFVAAAALTPERRDAIDTLIVGGLLSLRELLELHPLDQGNLWRNYYYTLYSFEKAMDLGGIHTLGGVDWYLKHARVLLGQQKQNGAWGRGPNSRGDTDPEYELVSTSFALLFLNRATRSLRITPAGPVPTGAGSVAEKVDHGVSTGRVYLPSRDGMVSLSEVFGALNRLRSAELQAVAAEIVDTVPPDQMPDLLPYLASLRNEKRDAVDRFARVQVQRISGLDGDVSVEDLEVWLAQRASLRRWGDEGDRSHLEEAIQLLRDRSRGSVLRMLALATLQRWGAVEAVPAVTDQLEDPDPQLRLSAHRALENLTHERLPFSASGSPAERARGVELWRDYWRRVGANRLAERNWERLREALERATETDERARLRAEIVALGPWAVPRVEAILQSSQFAFDWVLIHQALTGEMRGL
ncbi:MAG: HEAT repeat domain-containing protein [Planctomycetota bacterium]